MFKSSVIKTVIKASPTLLADANYRRVIVSPTGQLNRCEDDVRRFFDAGKAGLEVALKAGAAKPLLVVFPEKSMPRSSLVSILGAASATYTNYELRKDLGASPKGTMIMRSNNPENLFCWLSGPAVDGSARIDGCLLSTPN